MIVSAITTIGIQCSKCGELQFITLSVFYSPNFEKESYCSACGATLLTLTRVDRVNYCIEYPCIYCGKIHTILTKRGQIWGKDLLQLVCDKKGLTIGYLGQKNQVENSCQEIKKNFVQLVSQLVRDEDVEYEFENFFIVYAVMEKLGKMVERGQIGCRCGNSNLTVEILPDRIELVCKSCQATGVIDTDNKEILRIIDGIGPLFLEENTTWLLDNPYLDHNLAKNK